MTVSGGQRTAVSGQPDFCPLSASEHTPFIQPAAKRRPLLFAFGNTVCLLSAAILYNSPLNQPALWAEPIGQCVST